MQMDSPQLTPTLINIPSSPAISEPATPIFHSALSTPEPSPVIKTHHHHHKNNNNKMTEDSSEVGSFEYLDQSYSPLAYSTPLLNKHQITMSPPLKMTTEVSYLQSTLKNMAVSIKQLSILPTPPERPEDDYAFEAGFPEVTFAHMTDPVLLGRAKYLYDLLPSNASQNTPRSWLILSLLVRVGNFLEIGTVALAGCVLDSLSNNFAPRWRKAMSASGRQERPELLIICALCISVKFTYDNALSNSFWADDILEDRFSLYSINTTERMMLQDIGYCLGYLSTPDVLNAAIKDVNQTVAKEYYVDIDEEDHPDFPYYSDESAEFEDELKEEVAELQPIIRQHSVKTGFVLVDRIYPISRGVHNLMARVPDIQSIVAA